MNAKTPQRILVTGGAGFIGSHVVDAYVQFGHSVAVVDNFSAGRRENVNPAVTLYEVDIRDAQAVQQAMADFQPTVINHHAAQVNVRHSLADPVFDAQTNIIGLLTLLEASKGLGHPLHKFIFSSSGGVVYGEQAVPTPEDSPKQPTSPYGVSKRTSELYLQAYQRNHGLNYVALRYANIYGPRQNHSTEVGIIGIIIEALLEDRLITIFGDGEQTRDFVHVADVVRANLAALTTDYSGPINIGTGRETSVNAILALTRDQLHYTPKLHYAPPKTEEQRRSVLEISRAKAVLGWQPEMDLETGVAQTLDWYQAAAR